MKIALLHNINGHSDELNSLMIRNREGYAKKQGYGFFLREDPVPEDCMAEWGMVSALLGAIQDPALSRYDWFLHLRKEQVIGSYKDKVDEIFGLKKLPEEVYLRAIMIELVRDEITNPMFTYVGMPADVRTLPLIVTPCALYRNHPGTVELLEGFLETKRKLLGHGNFVDVAASIYYQMNPEKRKHISFMRPGEWNGGIIEDSVVDPERGLGFIGKDKGKQNVEGIVAYRDGGWLASILCGRISVSDLIALHERYQAREDE